MLKVKPGPWVRDGEIAGTLKVRHPDTKEFVPDDGIEVDETDLRWARLIRDGDLIPA